jgi:hypothetical protein
MALWAASPASAATVNVHPGPHALRDAIRAAKSRDTLRIHQGRYKEHVTISKHLRLERVVGEARPVIDARCKANDTILVHNDGVTLDGLKVVGADEGHGAFPSEVFYEGVRTGAAKNLVVRDTCDAEYGINLFATGAVQVIANKASGFSDSGIYVGGITDTHGGRLNVRGNDLFGNNRGAIVEDTVDAANVRLSSNQIHDNDLSGEGPPDGVFLHNTDGIYLVANSSTDNAGDGYHADVNSDNNVFLDNTAADNLGLAFNDEGTGNCGSGNSFVLPACV